MASWDSVVDVVVVGSGAAGLTAAIAAREAGAEVLVLESTELIGGTSAMSGGGVWIPDNPLMAEAGVPDSYSAARTYLDQVIGEAGPASSSARRHAFLTQGPAMVRALQGAGFHFVYAQGRSDSHPERPGGSAAGRSIEGARWNLRALGDWGPLIRGLVPLAVRTDEDPAVATPLRTAHSWWTTTKAVGLASLGNHLIGREVVSMGNSLVAQLLYLALRDGVGLHLGTSLVDLVTRGDVVTGVSVRAGGATARIGARRGVLLAAGGFARDEAMRLKHHPHPTSPDWSTTSPGDTGDAIRAGADIGAALALMDDAWWGPVVITPDGSPRYVHAERSLPHSFVVDSTGQRFMNESEPCVDAVHHQHERNALDPAVPAWLILDSRHRRHYACGFAPPGVTPRSVLESGAMTRAETLEDLAAAIDVDPEGLRHTARRFAEFARTGIDKDFGRGASAHDRVYSDPRVAPNPNLGAVDRPPFYALRLWPGDMGTKGGLLTDEHARVLREAGSPITGLYAAGNTSASVMGRAYPGPGASLGPAMTFGWIGGRHAAAQEPIPGM